jgi:hypothetical protein
VGGGKVAHQEDPTADRCGIDFIVGIGGGSTRNPTIPPDALESTADTKKKSSGNNKPKKRK